MRLGSGLWCTSDGCLNYTRLQFSTSVEPAAYDKAFYTEYSSYGRTEIFFFFYLMRLQLARRRPTSTKPAAAERRRREQQQRGNKRTSKLPFRLRGDVKECDNSATQAAPSYIAGSVPYEARHS
ncbi:hypothetical protein ACOSQ2_004459 [Xanthoceras sorbifolium]